MVLHAMSPLEAHRAVARLAMGRHPESAISHLDRSRDVPRSPELWPAARDAAGRCPALAQRRPQARHIDYPANPSLAQGDALNLGKADRGVLSPSMEIGMARVEIG